MVFHHSAIFPQKTNFSRCGKNVVREKEKKPNKTKIPPPTNNSDKKISTGPKEGSTNMLLFGRAHKCKECEHRNEMRV